MRNGQSTGKFSKICGVRDEVFDNICQRSGLAHLIYNDLLAHADIILNGALEIYLKATTEYKLLDS